MGDTQAAIAPFAPSPPAASADAPNAAQVRTAREVLSRIFSEFSTARDSRKGAAWRQLQRDLSSNAEVLIMSGQITLPQMIDTMQKLEEYMGGGGEEDGGQDAAELVGRWLRGEEPPSDEFDAAPAAPKEAGNAATPGPQ